MRIYTVSLALLSLCLFFSKVSHVESQLQLDSSAILSVVNNMPTRSKLLLIADLLLNHPSFYQDLENTLISALPILGYDHPPGRFFSVILPWALHHLPDLLENDAFRGIMKIFIEEINAHNATADWYLQSGNTTIDRDYFASKLLSSLDYLGMGAGILKMKSVSDYFPYNSTDRDLRPKCYEDTMMFFDRLFVGEKWALNSMYIFFQ